MDKFLDYNEGMHNNIRLHHSIKFRPNSSKTNKGIHRSLISVVLPTKLI
jgi:hypothetical protein